MPIDKFKAMVWGGRVVSALAVFPFIPSAVMKIQRSPQVLQGMAQSGFPEAAISTIAFLEVMSVVVYLIPQTAILGAILLTGYLGGAICTHLRVGEPVYIPAVLGILVWLGIFLREPRLRAILPWRHAAS